MKSFHTKMGTLALWLAASSAACAILTPSTAIAGTCTIGFGDQTGLGLLWNGLYTGAPQYAGQPAGILAPTCTRAKCGQLATCSNNVNKCAPAPGQSVCGDPNWGCTGPSTNQLWYYEKCLFNAEWFYMDENSNTNYRHFHIPTDDPTLSECLGNSSTGVSTMGYHGQRDASRRLRH
jgi:hypothetical protein